MKNFINILSDNILFKGIDSSIIEKNLQIDTCKINKYQKGAIVSQQGDPCNSISLILKGSLSAIQLTSGGENLSIKRFDKDDAFGVALFCMHNPSYPFNLVSNENSIVIEIPFNRIEALLKNSWQFNQNYIRFLSGRVLTLKNKVKLLQFRDVRSRLTIYLTQAYRDSGQLSFKLPHKKVEIAEIIGVARPSISRELKKMEQDLLIKVNGQYITLLRPNIFK